MTRNLLGLLLPLACAMAGCLLPQDGETSFSSVLPGTWLLSTEPADPGACTQDYLGGPGTTLEMLPEYRSDVFTESFPARLAWLDASAAPRTADLDCSVGEYTGLETWTELDVVCTGALGDAFQPDPAVDAAWPLQARIEGAFTLIAPCDIEPEALIRDNAALEGAWTVSLTGPCTGTACGAAEVPTGADGQPRCVQRLSIAAQWEGCGTGASECRARPDGGSTPACEE